MAETKVLHCTCTNEYQDSKYGKGNRVHNKFGREKGKQGYRCTVCKDQKQAN